MIKKIKHIALTACIASLTACGTLNNPAFDSSYNNYNKQSSMQLYPDGYESGVAYTTPLPEKKAVVVPESYHVGAYQAPTSFKDRDKSWISTQNPQGYTIELANGEQPAEVAGVLQKAPKS